MNTMYPNLNLYLKEQEFTGKASVQLPEKK